MSNCGKTTHCCFFKGEVCQYLLENAVDGYRYSCGLRLNSDSWAEVYALPEYQQNVAPKMAEIGYPDIGCGDWPPPGKSCRDCGEGV